MRRVLYAAAAAAMGIACLEFFRGYGHGTLTWFGVIVCVMLVVFGVLRAGPWGRGRVAKGQRDRQLTKVGLIGLALEALIALLVWWMPASDRAPHIGWFIGWAAVSSLLLIPAGLI